MGLFWDNYVQGGTSQGFGGGETKNALGGGIPFLGAEVFIPNDTAGRHLIKVNLKFPQQPLLLVAGFF